MKFVIDVEYVDPDKDTDYIIEDIKAGLEFYGLQLLDIEEEK